jgi:hypothetical protein
VSIPEAGNDDATRVAPHLDAGPSQFIYLPDRGNTPGPQQQCIAADSAGRTNAVGGEQLRGYSVRTVPPPRIIRLPRIGRTIRGR